MNWKDLGEKVADFAPMIGRILPLPGGESIGNLIASVFGGDKNNPDQLWQKITDDPDALIKLKKLEQDNQRELFALSVKQQANRLAHQTASIEQVNMTMRAEAQSEHWWQSGWRPFWGFTAGLAFFLQIIAVCWLIITEPKNASLVIQALPSLVMLWGIPGGILGVTAWHRGMEKRLKSGEVRQTISPEKISNLARRSINNGGNK